MWRAVRKRAARRSSRSRSARRIRLSALAVVLVVLGVVVLLFFVGGVLGARKRDRQVAPDYERHLAEADQALEAARAADRGWDREGMERVANEALAQAHPGVTFERLDLVLVDDRPGVSEDRAHFEATGDGRRVRVVLTRGEAGWAGRVAD
jgi:hypothetical protein